MRPREGRLSRLARGLVAVAALLPLLTFVWPLWHYRFEAPQYPEGLAMQIWTSRLTGRVDLINQLNHYVGFMQLDAAEFWELRVLPVAVVVVSAAGLLVAARGLRRWLTAWLVGYGAIAVAGMADFFRWLWRFGHTIDPRAAITMEGYTPPMLGTSQFMNFYITAWPGWGAVALAGGFVLGALVLAGVWFLSRRRVRALRPVATAAALLALLALAACSAPKPVPIVVGEDLCAFCGMQVSDPRYPAQVVTRTGKAYKFDSLECMLSFLHEGHVAARDVHSLWVTDFARPGRLLRAEEARYLRSGDLRSPMGLNVAAFRTLGELEDVRAEVGGLEVRYADLEALVVESGLLERVTDEGGHGHVPLGDGSPDEAYAAPAGALAASTAAP